MSRDTFEDELRTLLHEAADGERDRYVDVDTGSVLGDGVRVVRRRRLVAAAVTSVLALVVGIGGWAALSGTVDRAQEVPAQPGPLGTGTTSTGVVDFGPEGTVVVSVDRRTGAAGARLERDGGPVGTATPFTASLSRPGASWGVVSQDPLVVAGVVPAGAENLTPQWAGDVPGYALGTSDLPGVDYTAFAVHADTTIPDAALRDLLWTEDDQVWAANRPALPSVSSDGATVFLDRMNGMVGLLTEGGITTGPSVSAPEERPYVLQATDPLRKNVARTTVAMVLPGPASGIDVMIEPDPDLELVAERSIGAPDGRETAVIVVVGHPADREDSGVASITWTDSTGERSLDLGAR